MSKTIEITILPDGSTQVQTKGYAGKSCLDASRFIERALGDTTSMQTTPEMYQAQQHGQRVEAR